MFKRKWKNVFFTYLTSAICFIILFLLGKPFFNLSFIICLALLPIVCAFITYPSVFLIHHTNRNDKISEDVHWEYINIRFNKRN